MGSQLPSSSEPNRPDPKQGHHPPESPEPCLALHLGGGGWCGLVRQGWVGGSWSATCGLLDWPPAVLYCGTCLAHPRVLLASSSKLQTPAHFQVFLSFDKSAHGGGGIIQGPNGQTNATRDINRMRVLRILRPRPNE